MKVEMSSKLRIFSKDLDHKSADKFITNYFEDLIYKRNDIYHSENIRLLKNRLDGIAVISPLDKRPQQLVISCPWLIQKALINFVVKANPQFTIP